MISYAGVSLLHDSEELRDWVAANASPAWAMDAEPPDDRTRTLFLSGPRRPWYTGPLEINVLRMPWSATRFGVGHFLASDAQLNSIRSVVNTPAGGVRSAPLVLTDGANTVTTSLYMLPARPLTGIPGEGRLWLITLVDSRWYWPYTASTISITPGTTTWLQLFNALASALDETFVVDSIPSDYLKPPGDLASNYDSLPQILDAAASSVGMRVVRHLNGTYEIQSTIQAKTIVTRNQQNNWLIRSGGKLSLTATTPSDLSLAVPASITVALPKVADGIPSTSPTAITNTLANLTLLDFGQQIGFARGDLVLYSTEVASFTSGSPNNAAETSALAEQIAADWYEWWPGTLDVTYNGLMPWNPEGQHDVEWRHRGDGAVTRVRRGPWREDLRELYHYGTFGSISPTGTNTIVGQNVTWANNTITYANNTVTSSSNVTTSTNDTTKLPNSSTFTMETSTGPTPFFTTTVDMSGNPTVVIGNTSTSLVVLKGIIETPPQATTVTTTVNNLSTNSTVITITNVTAAVPVFGILPVVIPTLPTTFRITNSTTSTFPITLQHNNTGGGTATYPFFTSDTKPLIINPGQVAQLLFISTSSLTYVLTSILPNPTYKSVSDTSITDGSFTSAGVITYATLTAARTVTLQLSSLLPSGSTRTIEDASGNASGTKTISVAPSGSDTINGSSSPIVVVNTPYGAGTLTTDGVSGWFYNPSAGASGTGTLNTLPKVTNATGPVYGNSSISDNGTNVTITEELIVNNVNGLVIQDGSGNTQIQLGTASGFPLIWFQKSSPNTSNYSFAYDFSNTTTRVNDGSHLALCVGGLAYVWVEQFHVTVGYSLASSSGNVNAALSALAANSSYIGLSVWGSTLGIAEFCNSSGNPLLQVNATGDIIFDRLDSSSANQVVGSDVSSFLSNTHATWTGKRIISVADYNAVRPAITMAATGSAAAISFLAVTTAIVAQTGDVGSALVAFGLMTGTPTFSAANITGITGIPVTADFTGQTTGISILSVSVPNDGVKHQYRIGGYASITNIVAGTSFGLTVAWTDENSTSQSFTMVPPGLTSGLITSAVFVIYPDITIRCAPNTNVIITTMVTGTLPTITYDAGGSSTKLN